MAVQNDPLQISPYTSTVPMVQIPPESMGSVAPNQPLPGQFTKRSTSALSVGDAVLKGIMAGHQAKVKRKYDEAQATIAASDKAEQSAFEQYQETLRQAGGVENEQTKAAYDAYRKVFDQSKQTKAALMIPEKPAKGDKKAGGKDKKGGGFMGGIKEFFEANPHIVPQIALMTMTPKPQGMSADTKTQVLGEKESALKLESEEDLRRNQKTYQAGYATFAGLSADEIAKLPPEAKKNYDAWVNAKAALTPIKMSGTTRLYRFKNPDGSFHEAWMYPEQAADYPDAEPVHTSGGLKPGTEPYFHTQYALKYGMNPEAIPPEVEKYLHDYWSWKQQFGAQWSESTVDIRGDRHTSSGKTPPPPPKPPAGFQPVDDPDFKQARPGMPPPPAAQAGPRVQPPPTAQARSGMPLPPGAAPQKSAGSSALPPPPTTGKKRFAPKGKTEPDTQYTARITNDAQKEQATGYEKAELNFNKALNLAEEKRNKALAAATKAQDQDATDRAHAEYDAEVARAKADLLKSKDSVRQKYDARVRQIGGTPGGQEQPKYTAQNPPPGAQQVVKDKQGNLLGWGVNGQFVPIGQ